MQFEFNIDRGGTFTDIYCEISWEGELMRSMVYKLLSVNPENYQDAPTEAIRRILKYFETKVEDKDGLQKLASRSDLEISGSIQQMVENEGMKELVDCKSIKSIRMGTTVATNALLERKGAKLGLLITAGFRDLLEIGNQSRLEIFDLEMKKAVKLYEQVEEVEERVRVVNDDGVMQDYNNQVYKVGETKVEILKELDKQKSRQQIKDMKMKGIESIGIVLVNSYLYSQHENQLKQICIEEGYSIQNISVSHEIQRTIKIINRGLTTMVDGYLNPIIQEYLNNFKKGFIGIDGCEVLFMQSDGGLTRIDKFIGSRAILSGPAGGVVGFIESSKKYIGGEIEGILGFDMGGTSTDVSRYKGVGNIEHIYDSELCGIQIASPHIDINTVASGGGSMLFFEEGIFRVGPQSSGAYPGPVCYSNQQGQLSITDANLLLGRISPKYFPKIFGANKNEGLNYEKTRKAFEKLQESINKYLVENGQNSKSIYEIAQGFVDVANENMCRPIRLISQGKGVDPNKHMLVCFGGAGGQHATQISEKLNINQIFIHKYSGILSSYGMSLADIVEENIATIVDLRLGSNSHQFKDRLDSAIQQLQLANQQKLSSYLVNNKQQIEHQHYLGLKYYGTDTVIMVEYLQMDGLENHFKQVYKQQYGFDLVNRDIVVENVRVRSLISSVDKQQNQDKVGFDSSMFKVNSEPSESVELIYLKEKDKIEGYEVGVYQSDKLKEQTSIEGPAILIQQTSTIVVDKGWTAYIVEDGIILRNKQKDREKDKESDEGVCKNDPIQLAIFGNRFMSIAEQMGIRLKRTSISVNIKERLDFSCALFDRDGNLVANAPHLPVHLGSMSFAVKYQIEHYKSWKEGESILSNHPESGGSHLPDLTVISPVYYDGQVIFYVASRGHHSDIGGITPGSMPAFSQNLDQEGIAIKTFIIQDKQGFKEQQLRELFKGDDKIHGSRNIEDNVSDLGAQLSANNLGIQLVQQLIDEYSLNKVLQYMKFIQDVSEDLIKKLLYEVSVKNGLKELDYLEDSDMMDDGSIIKLKITIDRQHYKWIQGNHENAYSILVGLVIKPWAIQIVHQVWYILRFYIH